MAFILGKKLGMTQVFSENGSVLPVTVVGVEDNVVLQVRSKDKDGYEAVQVGTGARKGKNVAKAQKGHFKEMGSFMHVREFRNQGADLKTGDKIEVTTFALGDKVRVTGMMKGKGFQGVVKRHGFAGMPRSHGHRAVQRHAGSIGQRFPQHPLKGMRMAGRMGGVQRTTRGLTVVSIDSALGVIAIKGAVPGNIGGWVKIETTKK